jgi:hypothetical protein
MKFKLIMTPAFVLLIIASVTGFAKPGQTRPEAKMAGRVLYDFRMDHNSAPLKITPATQRSVFSKMFRRYLNDESKCERDFEGGGADPLKAARAAGQIVPSIVDMTTGNFTAAGQIQTLYVVSVNECNASHADNYGTKRVSIFSGPNMVADVDVDFKSSILLKTDLNLDGVDELLMTAGDMHQGILTEVAGLLEFRNGRMRVIDDLGTVVEDECASEMPGSTSKGSVISVVPNLPGKIKLKIDNYQKGCKKRAQWRLVSTGKQG